MVSNLQRRAELRPHGITSPACKECYFFSDCGGYQAERSLATCFVETCCDYTGADKTKCNAICPHKSDFPDWVSEVGGLRFDKPPQFTQPPLDLPMYVPMIDHKASRKVAFDWPVVAVDTYKAVRLRRQNGTRYSTVAETPEGLRDHFRIHESSKVILRGIAKDPPLERWWENRLESNAPAQLARIGIHAAIAPNFSHFLGVPRTDNLANRKRQLKCIRELADAGITVLPHLSAVMPADWQFWQQYLQAMPSVSFVAKEFQTGDNNRTEGRKSIERLARLQDSVKRNLHPVVIGGAQYTEALAIKFERFTLIDSNPFIKATRRRMFDLSAEKQPWSPKPLPIGEPIDALLYQNVTDYSKWIDARVQQARNDFR